MVSLHTKSVSMAASAAIPSSVNIAPGSNRRFFLSRYDLGSPSVSVNPLLGGQGHDYVTNNVTAGYACATWHYDEATLQAAGIGAGGGSAALTAFSESGGSEPIWVSGTIRNAEQSEGPFTGTITNATPRTVLNPFASQYPDAGRIAAHLQFILATDANARLDTDWDEVVYIKGPVIQTSYVGYLLMGMSDSIASWSHPITGCTGYMAQCHNHGDVKFKHKAGAGKPLPIKQVKTRAVDAKTIADRYNMGVPTQPDYEFPGGRKFEQ